MKKKSINDEIDLLELILIILKNKLKIILITISTLVLTFGYFLSQKETQIYHAISNINPITLSDKLNYVSYNSFLRNMEKLNKPLLTKNSELEIQNSNQTSQPPFYLNRSLLLELFLDMIEKKEVSKKLIKKLNLIDKKNYNNNKSYEEAVSRLASSFKLSNSNDKNKESANNYNWTIEFNTKNKNDWNNFLIHFDKALNKEVQIFLKQIKNKMISDLKKNKQYKIDDLDQKILYTIENHKQKTEDRLAYLREQALLARELGIRDNVWEINSIRNNKQGDITILNTDQSESYYIKGYRMIEKEIEIISSRNDSTPFIKDLQNLKNQKREIILNKDIERLEKLLNQTPIFNSNNFIAASIDHNSTQYFTNENFSPKDLFLKTILFGFLFAVFYVLIDNSIKKRR